MLRAIRIIQRKKGSWTKATSELKLFKTVEYYSGNGRNPIQSVRNYSSKHPKKSGSGGSGTLYTVGILTLAGGATLSYAKYDPDFRKTLVDYAPFTDTLIKTIFQEESALKVLAEYYQQLKNAIHDLIFGDTKDTKAIKDIPIDNPPIKEYKAPTAILTALEKDVKKPQETYSEIRLERLEQGEQEPKVDIVGTVRPTSEDFSETDTRFVQDLEEQVCQAASEAVNAYNKAVYVLKSYNRDIEHIIDEAVDHAKPEVWETVKRKTHSKEECTKRAQEKAEEACKKVTKLKELISRPDFQAETSTKEMIKNNIAKVQEDIAKAKKEYELEKKIGNVTEKYWEKVEESRQHFSEELEALFPNIDLSKKQLQVNEEDLDLFVLHAYARVLFYQKELAKMETVIQEKIKSAVEAVKKNGGGDVLSSAQICEAIEQEKRRLTLCFQQQSLMLKKECDDELREQLKRQSQTFTDHLNDAIKTRELEIERDLARKFDEQLESERCKYKMQLAAMVGRLRGLDHALKAKADADASSKQGQILWSACQALLRSIKAGCPGVPWKEQIRPLDPEITAVKEAAAPSDELVQIVIKGIPEEAVERGVYPEDALRERFLKVEKVARTVALVPEQGAALPIYILSYIQSMLLVKAASPIPQAELNDEQVDFSKLNTNDILQRARYWLDRGDFAQCLKYMNLLKGAPRSVAKQWMNETRILLETQQAANTLMAHAASSSLTYL